VTLFSESTGRVLISCDPVNESAVEALAAQCSLPWTRLGTVRDSGQLVTDQFVLDVSEVRDAWRAVIPQALSLHEKL